MIKKISYLMVYFVLFQTIFVLGFYVLFMWLNYEDRTFSGGSAYGFSIGQSKEKCFKNIYNNLTSLESGFTEIYIAITVTEGIEGSLVSEAGKKLLVQTYLDDEHAGDFMNTDKWKFYLNASYFNFIELTFEDGNLAEVYRHKKKFDIP